jgi:hypothetical protein
MVDSDNDITAFRAIPFRGSCTLPEVYEAIALAQPLGNKIATWTLRSLLALGFAYMVWLAGFALFKKDGGLTRMAFVFLGGTSFVIGVVLIRYIRNRRLAARYCREGKFLYEHTEGEVDAVTIRTKSERGEGAINWSAFCGYRLSDNVAVLYMRFPDSYLIMVRSKFSNAEDWERLSEVMRQKLKKM